MTPQPKTCGECRPIVSGVIGVCIELCPCHASADDLYEAAKAALAYIETSRWAVDEAQVAEDQLRAAIAAYEGK